VAIQRRVWSCLYCTRTFFGLNYEDPNVKIALEKQLNFLTWWGKLSRQEAIRLPKWKRLLWIDLTIENLKRLYGEEE
jgi:hypothetical protein